MLNSNTFIGAVPFIFQNGLWLWANCRTKRPLLMMFFPLSWFGFLI